MNKKRLLVITTSFPYSTAVYEGFFVYELCRRLSKNFEVFVLAPHIANQPKEEKMEDLKVFRFQYAWPASRQQLCYGAGMLNNIRVNLFNFFWLPFFSAFLFLGAKKIIRENRIDLIQAHWIFPSGVLTAMVSKITKVPLLITTQGSDVLISGKPVLRSMAKFALKKAKKVTVLSQSSLNLLLERFKISRDKLIIATMGVDTSKFKPDAEARVPLVLKRGEPLLGSLLFVGWLDENKGLRYLLHSIPEILKKFPGAKLKIVGTGHLEQEFKEFVKKLAIEKSVEFLGGVKNEDMPALYMQSDLFILPSLSEGIPVSILEAMASGCPVVVTKVGGIPEFIEHKKTGYLIEPRSVGAISSAVIDLLGDEKLRNEMAKNAHTFVRRNYDWEIVVGKFEKIINAI